MKIINLAENVWQEFTCIWPCPGVVDNAAEKQSAHFKSLQSTAVLYSLQFTSI